jgi:hypothetical protein
MTRAEKIAAKKLDTQIEAIYRQHCCNIQIGVFDIAKVFEAGRKAHAANLDMVKAIVDCVESIRQN